MRKRFLDVIFDDIPLSRVREIIDDWLLNSSGHHTIVTPGPAFVVRAWKEPLFKETINLADLSLCDGYGVKLFSLFSGKSIKNRITGVDLVYELCQRAHTLGKSVFLLGSRDGVAEDAARVLKKQFPHLRINADNGPEIEELLNRMTLWYQDLHALKKTLITIQKTKPDILIVAFGPGKQEKWIHEHLFDLPSVRIAVGVGGALDMISGRVKRAPVFMRRFGLEWVWRTFNQPRRIKRAYASTVGLVALMILVYTNAFLKPKRHNVLAVIVNKQRNKFLLINNRMIERHAGEPHWQFVQGGIDPGETAEEAMLRELEEETGTMNYHILKKSTITDYAYPGGLRSRYSRKVFTLFYVELTGENKELVPTDESSGYLWVSKQELLRSLNPMRKSIGMRILEELKTPAFHDILKPL